MYDDPNRTTFGDQAAQLGRYYAAVAKAAAMLLSESELRTEQDAILAAFSMTVVDAYFADIDTIRALEGSEPNALDIASVRALLPLAQPASGDRIPTTTKPRSPLDAARNVDPRGPGAAFALAVYGPEAFAPVDREGRAWRAMAALVNRMSFKRVPFSGLPVHGPDTLDVDWPGYDINDPADRAIIIGTNLI